jgi:hypothetical protein
MQIVGGGIRIHGSLLRSIVLLEHLPDHAGKGIIVPWFDLPVDRCGLHGSKNSFSESNVFTYKKKVL